MRARRSRHRWGCAARTDSNGANWQTASYWSNLRASAPLANDDGRNFLRSNQSAPIGLKYGKSQRVLRLWETDYHTAQWSVVRMPRCQKLIAKMKAVRSHHQDRCRSGGGQGHPRLSVARSQRRQPGHGSRTTAGSQRPAQRHRIAARTCS